MEQKFIHRKKWIIKTLLVIALGFISVYSFAQTDPTDSIPGDPGALSVYTVQNMSFGAFSIGSTGGTVIISNNGSRSVTGDVVLLNLGTLFFQSIFNYSALSNSLIIPFNIVGTINL